jgi:L-threonylcarbamoyladenylate synthase
MVTQVIPQKKGLKKAAELIKSGEVVAFKTETVYGLGADFSNPKAVEKIFKAKNRPCDNPLIVHLADAADAELVARDIPKAYFELAEKFMPGPLTVVLKKRDTVPAIVTAGGDTVAVRVPDNAVVRKLIKLSAPLAAPSANRSTHVSPTSARHVAEDLDGIIPLILDGGECNVGIESTVLDLTSEPARILRPGAVTAQMLSLVLMTGEEESPNAKIPKSPGVKYPHYAPRCETWAALNLKAAKDAYDRAAAKGKKTIVLCLYDWQKPLEKRNAAVLGKTVRQFAKNYYAALRNAEKTYDYIIIQGFSDGELEHSLMNRITKSSGGKILD